jgi:hypothetical protein
VSCRPCREAPDEGVGHVGRHEPEPQLAQYHLKSKSKSKSNLS